MFNIIGELPLYLVLSLPLALGIGLFFLIRRLLFVSKLKKVSRGEAFDDTLSENQLIRYYRSVERLMSQPDSALFKKKEIGDLWVKKLVEGGGTKWFNLIVKHFPNDYLYPCFLHGLKKRSLFRVFQDFMKGEEVLTYLEILGRSCKSEPFDGRSAAFMFDGQKNELRTLLGSSSEDVRFFAYNVLLHYEDALSMKAVHRGFADPHRATRLLLVESALFENRDEAYQRLERILLNDPSRNVRNAAGMRINKELRDLKTLDIHNMNQGQAFHYLSLMEEDSDKDEQNALEMLHSEDQALVLEAARFLARKGVLTRLFSELHPGDRDDFMRKVKLLARAVNVNETRFFEEPASWNREGSLLGAALLLKGRGDLKWLEKLATLVFGRDPYASDSSLELYFKTIETIDVTGSDLCHRIKALELKKHQDDPLIMEALLASIPKEREFFYRDDLLYLLEFGQDFCRLLVRERLSQYDPTQILTFLYDHLLDVEGTERYRSDVLMILIRFHLDYTLQMILEHLPLLDDSDLILLPTLLEEFSPEKLHHLTEVLFDSCDGEIHMCLLYALPLDEARLFEQRIYLFLEDRDWEIRRAALVKLQAMGSLTLEKGLPLLNDPRQEVRSTAVTLLIDLDAADVLEVVGELLYSEEEGESVKTSILYGLMASTYSQSLALLFEYMTLEEKFRAFIITLLETRNDRDYIENLIENFRKADPSMRELVKPVLVSLGLSMEEPLLELMSDQSSQARKQMGEILHESGYIDRLVHLLNSPDPAERRRVIEMLISLEESQALKVAILAVGDPDKTVRIAVVRALEKLNFDEGNEMLKALLDDPDKKVRKYTQWALDRIKSKNLSVDS